MKNEDERAHNDTLGRYTPPMPPAPLMAHGRLVAGVGDRYLVIWLDGLDNPQASVRFCIEDKDYALRLAVAINGVEP